MGKCYYYGKEQPELKSLEKSDGDKASKKSDGIKRIIIDDNTELVIEKDTIYEIDRKCERCLKNKGKK